MAMQENPLQAFLAQSLASQNHQSTNNHAFMQQKSASGSPKGNLSFS
jgi:hypothetical protein